MSFKDSYLGKLREKIGHDPVLIPGARVVILNEKNEMLFIKRSDFGTWGLIGGSSEYGESIIETATREVSEEAGIVARNLKLWGISTSLDDEIVEYPNGDIIHAYSIMFYTSDWDGEPTPDNLETTDIQFFSMESLPENMHPNTRKAVDKFLKFFSDNKVSIS